jgi:microcystin-dependent protein
MTQATDLGNVLNQLAANYRARVNVNLQSIVTQHYGATEPAPVYPNMIWFSSGDGYIKLRNPTNSGWQTIGTIGPPMQWTNVPVQTAAWKTGDVKPSFSGAPETGWIFLDDGTIGDQYSGAISRANPDCWPLYSILWPSGGIYAFAQGTWTPVGKGASAAADWAAHRHISLPRACGRAMTTAGQGKHMDVNVGTPNTNSLSYGWWTNYNGEEQVQLNWNHMPEHAHWVPAHNHNLARALTNFSAPVKSTTGGPYSIPDGNSGITWTETWPGSNSGNAGANLPHSNLGPRFYIFLLIKL